MKPLVPLVLGMLFMGNLLHAQLKVAKIFSDNAVLQRNIDIPIWGTASPNTRIEISFATQTLSTQADNTGNWKSTLTKMPAGGPYTLIITSDKAKIKYQNVLIGDVWLCSGQSNMEWNVSNSNNPKGEIANATDDQIRHFYIPHTYSLLPQDTLVDGNWEVCSPETAGDFTAVGYFFAKNIRKHQDVPIGLLHTSWGGSRIEPWMRAEILGYKNAEESAILTQQYMDSVELQTTMRLKKLLGDELPMKDLGMKGDKPFWASPNYNHEAWDIMTLPNMWESQGYPDLDGVVWFRKEIYLTKEELKKDIVVNLGTIDDADITYMNGQQVGAMNAYNANRNYTIPMSTLREGVNILTVRVYDSGWGGGFSNGCDLFYYESAKGRKSLCGDWHFQVGQVLLTNSVMPNQFPTLLYNFMIHPIVDYPIKGALWYQGESNASIEGAKAYETQFPTMIKDWRKLWNCGDFPFLWVQLANWQAVADRPLDTGWARLRAAQSKTLEVSNTAQAVIIDIGEADDIHPRNKQDVGYRLSLGARKIAYGEELVHSGPVYKSMKVEGNKIILDFELFGSQLKSKDGTPLKEFAIAGPDKQFYWAKAQIEGNQVIVYSDLVKNPMAVRYAWANNPDQANLYNVEGLPASPFRTDDW